MLFEFDPLKIYSFGAFMALATVSALGVVYGELKGKGYRPDLALTMVIAVAAGGRCRRKSPYSAGARVHPTPIYEFLQSALIFALLWALRKKSIRAGTMFWLYFV